MSFKEALQKLGIEKYSDRIFNSNSHGELFHLQDYIDLAKLLKKEDTWFPDWFEAIVKGAEKNWGRPESIFQHVKKELYLQIQRQLK